MGDSGSPRAIRDSSSSFHFRDIEAHATGARTIILQHLRAMMLDAWCRTAADVLFEISNPLPTFVRSRRFERVRDWKATRTPPLHVAVQRGHKSFSHSSGTCLEQLMVHCFRTCQVSYRASDARSCHSDIHSTFPPKLEFGETPPLSDSGWFHLSHRRARQVERKTQRC